MKAAKGNKEYMIDEKQQKFYQDAGYDILDENGIIVAYGRGKTVPYEDYKALVEENRQLMAKILELESVKVEPEKKAVSKRVGE